MAEFNENHTFSKISFLKLPKVVFYGQGLYFNLGLWYGEIKRWYKMKPSELFVVKQTVFFFAVAVILGFIYG